MRKSGGTLARFANEPKHKPRNIAALQPDHPALLEGRTVYPRSVRSAGEGGRVLISGTNNPKIGGKILRGEWSGMPVFTLSLEERATCPRTCEQWDTCYGNAMPFAKRHVPDTSLLRALEDELTTLQRLYPHGFAVRLHVLGDFFSTSYVDHWQGWLEAYPALRVWGYTAWGPDTSIGEAVQFLNRHYSDRWRLRTSVAAGAPIERMQATTIWRDETASVVPEGNVCPASLDKTWTCGTCALCWSPAMDDKRVVFIGHGRGKR